MNDNFNSILILNESELKQIENKKEWSIIDILPIDKKFIVQFEKSFTQNLNTLLNNNYETHNINIAIASAITAGAPIYMTKFKNNNDYNLFYTDTDSIYVDKPLNNNLVNPLELGKLKLEYIANKAIFLTPKNLIYPLLPFKIDGLTIHPTGKFCGIYFSEELKIVKSQGYKIKLINGYEFSKTNLFEEFINDFIIKKK